MSIPSTYGLAGGVRNPAGQPGSLIEAGQSQAQAGMSLLGGAAEAENRRNMVNQQLEQEAKAGNAQLGATVGSMAGFAVGGPFGAVIGGSLGAIASKLF